MKQLHSVPEVLEALGGLTRAAAIVDRTAQHANGWRITGKFPSKTFIAFSAALKERGYTAPASLWGMVEPATSEGEAA